MSCPKTQHLLTEYFSDDLTVLTRDEIDRHLVNCENCRAELDMLLATREQLSGWRDERVPHWDRGVGLFRREHKLPVESRRSNRVWQWLPTAASFAMLALVALNVTVHSNSTGFSIAFGSSAIQLDELQLEQRLATFESAYLQQQEQALQAFLTRMDERQDSNNLRLLQAVLDQSNQLNGENFERMYTYFEQQREQDLQTLQSGYQQLVDSDYQTLQNVQQLANFVRFQGDIR
ncbi:MAG: zf-HC2 domain-containing protein [Pseudohongiellaceae bacterium]